MIFKKNKQNIASATSTDLYRRMIEEIQDYAIILLDKDGIIQNWNKGAQSIKGYNEEEILGKHFSIFYFEEDILTNLPFQLLERAAKEGRAIHEGWRKRKNNSRFWGSITITAVHDDKYNIIGFCKVTRDLTDKKFAEDELRMSEQRYHQMIAEVQDYAIILLSREGIIQNWNLGAEKIKGYTAEEAIGRKIDIFYTPEDKANRLPEKLLKLATETGKATHEGWRLRKNGTKFWGTIVITALHGKDGSIIGFSKVTRDLTEKKEAEEKIIAYNAELQIQNRELEQFAYVASHDLQEPLRKIQIFTELIQENYNDHEFANAYFAKLDASAKRLSQLVKSLLEYSRLSRDRNEIFDENVDLNQLIEDVKNDLELLIKEKNAIIRVDNLPVITGNRIQLGQLFCNLINNSLKFCDQFPHIQISFHITRKEEIKDAPESLQNGNYYHFIIKDNGIGFEQKYDKLIFSLFQRLHSKTEYDGTGIGLSLCKKIVENHSGYISANSELGKGATFNIYLPVVATLNPPGKLLLPD